MHCSGGVHSSIVDTKSNLVNTAQCSAHHLAYNIFMYVHGIIKRGYLIKAETMGTMALRVTRS